MSGGGSRSSYADIRIDELYRKMQESQSETKAQKFESDIAELINSLLVRYNDRDTQLIKDYLDEIKKCLCEEIEGTVDLLFGGSVAKRTYVDGLSDIDTLVLVNKSELKDSSPTEIKQHIYTELSSCFRGAEIKEGNLAITVKFKDAEIQLLPAVKHQDGFKISNSSGEKWAEIKPRKFTELLTKYNQQFNNKLVPTIKLAKSIIANMPENRQLKGYHIEALSIEAFKKYDGAKTHTAMLTHFFKAASELVLTPLKDKTGQSIHVDAYLGDSNSLNRRLAADSLRNTSRKMESATNGRLIEDWKDILSEK